MLSLRLCIVLKVRFPNTPYCRPLLTLPYTVHKQQYKSEIVTPLWQEWEMLNISLHCMAELTPQLHGSLDTQIIHKKKLNRFPQHFCRLSSDMCIIKIKSSCLVHVTCRREVLPLSNKNCMVCIHVVKFTLKTINLLLLM